MTSQMRYDICWGCDEQKALHVVPYAGCYCDECYSVISLPFTLESVIPSESIVVLAERMQREFADRGGRLQRMARELIQNRRAASAN